MVNMNSTIFLNLSQLKKFSHAFSIQYARPIKTDKPTFLLYSKDTGLTLYSEFNIWHPIPVSDEELGEIATLNIFSPEEAKRVFFEVIHKYIKESSDTHE